MKTFAIATLALMLQATPTPTLDGVKEWQGNKAALTRFYDSDLNVACYIGTTSGQLDMASIPQSPPTMTCIKVK